MAYTTIDDPSAHFHTRLYTATGNAISVTNNANAGDFQPDWIWLKSRNNATNHNVFDSSRGQTKRLYPNTNDQEDTVGTFALNSNGFSIGGSGSSGIGDINVANKTMVAWQWKANGGTTSSNTDGTITATVQANTTAGFSIVTFTGNGASQTVGHGLNQAPVLSIRKKRETTGDWFVHTNVFDGGMDYLKLSTTAASSGSSLANFTSTTGAADDNSNQYVVYFFHSVKGYSKIGTYTGNGNADGPFIYTGFKPALVIAKRTDGSGNDWRIADNKRDPFNIVDGRIKPNTTAAEDDNNQFDFLSNGFKLRTDAGDLNGTSGHTFIYLAFAEHPFVSSEGVPVTAR